MQLATSCIIWFSNSTSTRSGARSCQHAACASRGKILLKLEVKCTARGARNMNENSWRKKQYLTNMRNVCRILDFGESSFDDHMAHILSGVEQLEVGCLCVKSMISLFSDHQGNLYQIQTLAKENLQGSMSSVKKVTMKKTLFFSQFQTLILQQLWRKPTLRWKTILFVGFKYSFLTNINV